MPHGKIQQPAKNCEGAQRTCILHYEKGNYLSKEISYAPSHTPLLKSITVNAEDEDIPAEETHLCHRISDLIPSGNTHSS